MAFFSVNNVAVKGIASAVPSNTESNWDYALLNDKEKKLLVKTTGVETRRVAPRGLTTSDLCYESAKKLMNELGWNSSEISILIFLSQSPDYYLPATAIILQDRLGLPRTTMAFDIGLGCSGYVYGLSVISGLMASTGLKKGLLLMGDVSSATCAFEDKSTYPLFGDAGTATALEVDSNGALQQFSLFSDGSGHDAIIIPDGGIRNLVSPQSFEKKEIEKGISRANLNLALNGLDVFNFSIREVPPAVRSFFQETNTDADSYDYFVMHQANKLMNETIRKKLKFETDKVPYSLQKYGNTSSASIPLTITDQLAGQVRESEKSLLLAGFGVGLSWGICSLSLNQVACPKVIEV